MVRLDAIELPRLQELVSDAWDMRAPNDVPRPA